MTDASREAAALVRSELGSDDEQRREGDVAGETARRRPRVLLVDDDAPICQLVESALREAGFDVVAAMAPKAALAAAAADDFDVVVSDVHMPGMSGPELYGALRQLQPWLPVVFISGGASGDNLPAGAPLIRKPFDLRELAAAVSRALTHAAAPADAAPAARARR